MKLKDMVAVLAKDILEQIEDKGDMELPEWEPFKLLESVRQRAALSLIIALLSLLKKELAPLGALALSFENCSPERHVLIADGTDNRTFYLDRLNLEKIDDTQML